MNKVVQLSLIFILVLFSKAAHAQQSLDNLNVLSTTIDDISNYNPAFKVLGVESEGVNYSLSPLLIDADGTDIYGASLGLDYKKNNYSLRYLNIDSDINQFLLRYSRSTQILEIPSRLNFEYVDTEDISEQFTLSGKFNKSFNDINSVLSLVIGWRERKLDQGDDESDFISTLSFAKLFGTFGLSASYSPKNDLSDESFVIAAQLIKRGFYLEVDDDETIVLTYRFSWN